MYAIPLKQFYSNAIQVATKSSISRYQVPHSKGVCLFCTSHLGDQFLRLAVAVKNKVYMLAYKHPATFRQGSPATPGPVSSVEPKDNFIKHRVSGHSTVAFSFYGATTCALQLVLFLISSSLQWCQFLCHMTV